MTKECEFLVKIVQDAAELITDEFTVKAKGDKGDLVTNFDTEIETFIIDKLKEKYPKFTIVSEEWHSEAELTENCFIIDPIDGTINFARGIPLWCIQVAMIEKGKTVAAAIHVPKMNELFCADINGTYLNGKKVSVLSRPIKESQFVAEGGRSIPSVYRMGKYSKKSKQFSCCGVALSYVACGRLQGEAFLSNAIWDYFPGQFLVKQAGGFIDNAPNRYIAAADKEMLQLMKKACWKFPYTPNFFVLHSLNADTLEGWGPDTMNEIRMAGCKGYCPQFKIREESSFENFCEVMDEFFKKGELDSSSIVIAHSISCAYFVRYCRARNFVPHAFICIAGFGEKYNHGRTDYFAEVLPKAIPSAQDYYFIKEKEFEKYCLYSDEEIPKRVLENFAYDIGAKKVYLEGYGHFTPKKRIYKIPEMINLVYEICTLKDYTRFDY